MEQGRGGDDEGWTGTIEGNKFKILIKVGVRYE